MQRALMLASLVVVSAAQTMVTCNGTQYMVSSTECSSQAEYNQSMSDATLNECAAEFCPSLTTWWLVRAENLMLDKGASPDDCRVMEATISVGVYFCAKPEPTPEPTAAPCTGWATSAIAVAVGLGVAVVCLGLGLAFALGMLWRGKANGGKNWAMLHQNTVNATLQHKIPVEGVPIVYGTTASA